MFGKSCCIWAKVIVLGQIGCIWRNWLNSGKSNCIRASGCIRANWLIRAKWLYSGKVVVFGQSGCILGKTGCIRQIRSFFTKLVVLGQTGCNRAKWLYSAIWLYSDKDVVIRRMVIFGQK